jgi:ABC-type bacteriocin/lantibiotic exporter with double-glycine peptidase domain
LKSIFRLMSYVKFYWKEASIAVLCSLLATLINLAPPWFIKVIIDDIIVNKNVNKLKLFIIGLLLIYVSRSIFVSARSLLTNHLGQKVIRNVRNSVYEHLQRLSLSYYEDTQTGTIMSKLINDVNVLQDVIINTTETLIVSVLTLIGISVILLYMNSNGWSISFVKLGKNWVS